MKIKAEDLLVVHADDDWDGEEWSSFRAYYHIPTRRYFRVSREGPAATYLSCVGEELDTHELLTAKELAALATDFWINKLLTFKEPDV